MRRLKINQLETFVVYMKTGSVTQAAQELNTTHSNASKKLKQIEDIVGRQLLVRAGGKLRPTREAGLLYEHVVRLMHHLAVIEPSALILRHSKSIRSASRRWRLSVCRFCRWPTRRSGVPIRTFWGCLVGQFLLTCFSSQAWNARGNRPSCFPSGNTT